jgi:DHA2 family multidrug resistance protein-like MFS transporter
MSATLPAFRPVTDRPAPAGLRSWIGLAALVLPTLLVAIDTTVLSVALPAIGSALGPSSNELLWIVDVYPLVLAGLLVTMGTVGDRIGRRRLLMIGATGFGAVSFMAAFATSGPQLLAARVLLGLFGAMLMPATLALLHGLFADPVQRRFAVAVWASGFAAGAAAGPLLGGVLLEHFWWGSVFLVNVPVLAVLLVALPLVVHESRNPAAGRIDVLGVVLSLLAMTPIVLAIKLVAHDGPTIPAGIALAIGSAAAVAFVARARARLAAGEEPILDVTLFRSPVLRLSAIANATSMFGYTGMLFFSAQYLTLVVGLSPMETGMVLLPGFVITIVAGIAASGLARWFRIGVLVPIGLTTAAAGLAVAALLTGTSVGLMVLASVLYGAGIGLSETITNDAILSAAPPARAGSASAVSETAYEIGAVLGTAVLGSVLSAVYSASVAAPAGPAHETLGGAVAAAAGLPTDAAAVLLDSARAAFVSGVTAASVLGAVALLAVATLVAVGLRHQ